MNKEFTDENLMREVAGNKLDVLQILFERHHKHVFNFLYKMCGDKMLSEDITQEVFYKVLKYRSSYKDGKFLSWMFAIARNSLITHFQRNRENHLTLQTVHYENLPEEDDNKNDDYSALHKALDQLKPEDRELLVLHKLQNLSHKDVAEIVGRSPGAVKTKTSRALKKLKEIYFKTVEDEV